MARIPLTWYPEPGTWHHSHISNLNKALPYHLCHPGTSHGAWTRNPSYPPYSSLHHSVTPSLRHSLTPSLRHFVTLHDNWVSPW
jgi:hypothetical protein